MVQDRETPVKHIVSRHSDVELQSHLLGCLSVNLNIDDILHTNQNFWNATKLRNVHFFNELSASDADVFIVPLEKQCQQNRTL